MTTTQQTARAGLIGFGMAGKHFHAPLLRAAGFEVVAAVTSRGEEARAAIPDVIVLRTADELLQRTDIDLADLHLRPQPGELLVLVGVRDDDTELLARLPFADGRRFTRLSVARLSRAEVAEQVESLLVRAPEPEFVAGVFERSAGIGVSFQWNSSMSA